MPDQPVRAQDARGWTLDPGVLVDYPCDRGKRQATALGAGARLRSGTVLYQGTRIGRGFSSGHCVVVREDCEIGDDVSVWSGTLIDYGCRIGDRVKIHAHCYVAQFTHIDDDAFLAPGVSIANDLYPGDQVSADMMSGPHIGAGAQIGVNVTLLPFVRIGAGALVGAGSVVARDVPPGAVAFGNPAVVRGRVADLRPVQDRLQHDDQSASRYRFADGPQPLGATVGPRP